MTNEEFTLIRKQIEDHRTLSYMYQKNLFDYCLELLKKVSDLEKDQKEMEKRFTEIGW